MPPNRGLWDSLGALDERTRRTARRGTETQRISEKRLPEPDALARQGRGPAVTPPRSSGRHRLSMTGLDAPSRAGRGRDRGGRRARNARTGTGYPRDANHPVREDRAAQPPTCAYAGRPAATERRRRPRPSRTSRRLPDQDPGADLPSSPASSTNAVSAARIEPSFVANANTVFFAGSSMSSAYQNVLLPLCQSTGPPAQSRS